MIDLKGKFKRQIEILGICLSRKYEGKLNTFDLAEMFGVEELTVKRDLREMRENGIDIHSVKSKGLGLFSKITDSKIRELIRQYSALNTADSYVEKSTSLFVTKLKEKSLANMVILQMCIDNKKTALIDYEKESDEMEYGQEISPLLIFQSDNYWRVLTLHNGKIKQYILNKIIDVRESNKHFTPIAKEKIEDVFRHSFRSWLGSDKFKIKLRFSPKWSDRIKPKQLLDSETFIENKDGSVTYEATVNSLDEIAGWVATRGEGVKVLEPEELKERVIQIAKGILKNYE
jgi:predicted DNA-binding transcriptional regulator YafY